MLTRDQKAQQIEWIKQQIKADKAVVFVGYRGLTVAQLDTLRTKVRDLGGLLKVVKTRLLKKALLSHFEMTFEKLALQMWDKPVAFVLGGSDSVAIAKTLAEFIKENQIVELFGGYIDAEIVNPQTIMQLAALPDKEELLAKVVGSLAAPIRGLVWGLRWDQYALVSVLRQKVSES